ncbi:Signal transduction histidine-protein kinase BarA [Marinomonas spartinae]|uniref:response regulator n=1 Tax=Marinomonas spartinae TaxID=1792290 RepID=UPI000808A1E8|nr:response regulator [Marinomonas spartinae]SBS32371.1 Signal transduction histidine-protein kinase BarA [Marinomonas spartinae]
MQDNPRQSIFVLIVEGDPLEAEHLQKMTRALGWQSSLVNDGSELVQECIKHHDNSSCSPDALLVSSHMPSMDGLSVTRSLARHIGREHLPAVLMISAYDSDTIIEQDTERLVDRVLRRPLNAYVLFNAVNDVVTNRTGDFNRVLQATSTEVIKAKWLPNTHLLVVDDSATNLAVVSYILKHNGAKLQTANSGEEALTILEDPNNDFDVVLMDVQMPGIDGLEATRLIRKRLHLTTLPIIALTAGTLGEEKDQALEAGMSDFLTKPIDPSTLITLLLYYDCILRSIEARIFR